MHTCTIPVTHVQLHFFFSPFISQLIARIYWIELRTICIKVIWYEIEIADDAHGARHQLKMQTADQIRQERFLFELGRKKECLYLFTDRHLMRCCRIVCNMPCISRTSVNKGDFIIASRTLLMNLKAATTNPLRRSCCFYQCYFGRVQHRF